jgi:type 1 fimbriae regulatory protein FimB
MPISSRAERKREYLTAEEIERLLAASKQNSRNPIRDHCILLLMFRHGLRVSELCQIRLADFDVETKLFRVSRLNGWESGPHMCYEGESEAVSAWLGKRKEMRPPTDCDTLFISERRKPLSRFTIHLMVRQIAEAARLGHLEVHPHMLRHSCGYALVNKGTDIRTIQGYLGNRSISVTARYTTLDRTRFARLF